MAAARTRRCLDVVPGFPLSHHIFGQRVKAARPPVFIKERGSPAGIFLKNFQICENRQIVPERPPHFVRIKLCFFFFLFAALEPARPDRTPEARTVISNTPPSPLQAIPS